LYTDDGGAVWASQTSNTTNAIKDVSGVSASSVWSVGASGTALVFGYNNVLLQANTGNAQTGAPSGTNLCTSLTLAIGVTLTCNHSALSKNTWYTFTLTTGVKSNTGDALAVNVTRAFRTIGAPALSSAITDASFAVATNVTITADFDNPIASSSLLSPTWATRSTSSALNAVQVIDATHTVAAGASGTTTRTADGGSTWIGGTAGSGQGMNGIAFPTSQIGYLVGDSGKILKTTDVGVTWTAQTSGTAQNLKAAAFADAITGWAVGAGGVILKTTNGGTSWTAQTSGTTEILFGLHAVNASTVYAVGNSTTILKTTNGGTTWTAQTGVVGNHGDVFCTSTTICWIASDSGLIYRTTDGGTNWTAAFPVSATWNGIYFTSATTGWVVGSGGLIYTSTDGGVNWTQQTSGTTQDLGGVSFTSATTGVAVGGSGTVLLTTNGGTSWTIVSAGVSGVVMNGIDCSSPPGASNATCWAVGANSTILIAAANNGRTWVPQTSGTSVNLEDIEALSTTASIAYVIGGSGTILKTTNGGTTWTAQTTGTTQALHGLFCFNESDGNNNCWAVGGDASNAVALKTTNGGTTWTALSTGLSNPLMDTYFFDATTGWIVGSGGIITKTANGGTTWTTQSSGTVQALYSVECSSATACIVVGAGGTVLTTSDGGSNWTSRTSGTTNDLRKLSCMGASDCLAVGASGTIIRTRDGGTNWSSQTSGTTSGLNAVHFFAAGSDAIAVGHSGTIIGANRNVALQANTGTTRSGTATGSSLCTSISLGNDGSGNANRRITCSHTALTPGFWYTLYLTGGSTGLASTSSDVLAADATRIFRTAFDSGHAFDDPTLSSLADEGYLTVTGSNTAASQAVFAAMLRSRVTTSDGTVLVTVPQNAVFTRAGGGTFDTTQIALTDYFSSATNVPGTKKAVIQYGVPGVSLTSSDAITIVTPVSSTVTAGIVLDVYRDADGDFSDATTKHTTCTVASSTCSFTTTSLSYFAATEPSGSPTQTDTTAPAKPTSVSCTSGSGTATCTWTDPADTDLSTIRVLLVQGDVTYLRGTPAKGAQTFTDPNTDTPTLIVGQTYTFAVQSVDTSGNRSDSATTTVIISSAAPAPADTTAPAAPTNLTGTSSSSKVTLTWKDPADQDLKLLRVLLLRGEATSILSILNKGLQTYTYAGSDLIAGLPFTFALEAEDTSGNKSSRVTTTVTVESGTAPTAPPTTPTTPPPTTPTEGAPKTTETTPATNTAPTPTEGAPKDTTTTTTPVTPETELEKGVKADEPPPAEDPNATKLLKDAVKAITETLTPPCTLTDAERQYLADAFTRSQSRAPSTGGDLQFLCVLRADPSNPVDPTKAFPKFRNLRAEELALKNFVNFFRRPPSRDTRDRPTPPEIAEKDWWAVKYMAYHLRLAPTARDLTGERTCLRIFLDRDVDLYKDGTKVRKARGAPPRDLFDYDFIRACTYSGLQFAEAAGATEE